MTPDQFNSIFEVAGGLLLIVNCWRLYKDKIVRGVSVPVTMFFTTWGFWNLVYYPYLDQWYSFVGGIVIATANLVWVSMAIYYGVRNGDY